MPVILGMNGFLFQADTLQGTNISHLGKRIIIFKRALGGDMLASRRVLQFACFFLGCCVANRLAKEMPTQLPPGAVSRKARACHIGQQLLD